jgi:hypothetical protein
MSKTRRRSTSVESSTPSSSGSSGAIRSGPRSYAICVEMKSITRLLLLAAEEEDRHLNAPELRAEREEQAVVATSVAQPLERVGNGRKLEAAPAELLGYGESGDAELGAAPPGRPAELAAPIALVEAGVQYAGSELGSGSVEIDCLLAPREVHGPRDSSRRLRAGG